MKDQASSVLLDGIRGEVLRHEPLSRHSSLKVGGAADFFVTPAERPDLVLLLDRVKRAEIPYLVIGGGYNLLVDDDGFRGVVISLKHLCRIERTEECVIRAEAGGGNGNLVRAAQEWSLGGVEFLIGIPGTVGGALAMNAGAHGEEIFDRVETVVTARDGIEILRGKDDIRCGYRFFELLPGEVILEATFRLVKREPADIESRIEGFLAHRRHTQRVNYPNAGSFFKNPAGEQAWRLIDAAGLRGCRIGDAQVSEIHTNFLVNRGGAKARDFIDLVEKIKARVYAASGILLEEEVRIVGGSPRAATLRTME